MSSAAFAGQYGIGLTGSFASISAEGTEADKDGTADTSVRKANASHDAIVPSVFAEYSFDNGFTVGYDLTDYEITDINNVSTSIANLSGTNAKILINKPHKEGIEYLPFWWFFVMKIVLILPKSIISKL